jgi:hypothetical protein
MNDTNGSEQLSPSDGRHKDLQSAEPREADPRQLEHEIEDVRTQLGTLISELDRRRHEVTDVKLQVRRHPVAAAVVAAAGLLATAGVVISVYRMFVPDPLTRRARKLAHALKVAAKDPDRLIRALEGQSDPRWKLLSTLLGAGTSAAMKLPMALASAKGSNRRA